MTNSEDDDHLSDFQEDVGIRLDENDLPALRHVASSRACLSEDELPWASRRHFVGRFWVITPRNSQPEIVSYRRAFDDAEFVDQTFLSLHPAETYELCWGSIDEPRQGLTPYQRDTVAGAGSSDWPRGEVVYAPADRLWIVKLAQNLIDDADTLVAVRQRFVIDEASCRVIGDTHLD